MIYLFKKNPHPHTDKENAFSSREQSPSVQSTPTQTYKPPLTERQQVYIERYWFLFLCMRTVFHSAFFCLSFFWAQIALLRKELQPQSLSPLTRRDSVSSVTSTASSFVVAKPLGVAIIKDKKVSCNLRCKVCAYLHIIDEGLIQIWAYYQTLRVIFALVYCIMRPFTGEPTQPFRRDHVTTCSNQGSKLAYVNALHSWLQV